MQWWAQYNLSDAMPAPIQATSSSEIDPDALAAAGRGQVQFPALNPTGAGFVQVDYTQSPPVFG